MTFNFGTRKAIEAAAVLLQQTSHRRMKYLRLLKLLYLADRQSLLETGRPIIGMSPVAMDHGPLHSEVYDLIKGEHANPDDVKLWQSFIAPAKEWYVQLKAIPSFGTLSRYEIEVLVRTWQQHCHKTNHQLIEYTHTLPEWIEAYREKTSRPIPLESMIAAVGRPDADEILKDAKETSALQALLGTGA